MFSTKSSHVLKKAYFSCYYVWPFVTTSIKGLKIFLYDIQYWMDLKGYLLENRFLENFLDETFPCGKYPWLWKISLINFFTENFLVCGKFPWSNFLWKISLTVKNFLTQIFCRKFSELWKISWSNFLWKISLTVEYSLDQFFLRKISLTVENLFDQIFCEKCPWSNFFVGNFLHCGIFETIKTYFLNLKQKLFL